MKKLLFLLFILGLTGSFVWYKNKELIDRWINFSFCDNPVYFKVGEIDPRFNIEKNDIIRKSIMAADLWNKDFQKPLFVYKDSASLSINLIYDERQESFELLNKEQIKTDEDKEDLDQKILLYETRRKEIESDLKKLNEDIAYWNSKGGAPKKEYEELNTRRSLLEKRINEVNNLINELNMGVEIVNQNIGKINEKVNQFNDLLKVKPEEGLYKPSQNKIEIYIYRSEQGFVHTVAHELGHALGLGHIEVENAIMNPISSDNSYLTKEDIELLTTHCEEKNKISIIKNNFKYILFELTEKLNIVIP